jgi:hypothetical protein
MSSPRVTYVPRPDAAPETEAVALAAIYRFLLFGRDAYSHDENDAAGATSTVDHAKAANKERRPA